jgi:hypothetical protein
LQLIYSDAKLETAKRSGCSLAGQPAKVIEIILDLIACIKRNLTVADREKNLQNRRDDRKIRKLQTPQERKESPTQPSKLLEITGAKGKPRVTIDEASIKAIKKLEEYELEQQTLLDRIARLEAETRSLTSDSSQNNHEGRGLLINSQKEVVNGIDVSNFSD